MHITSIVGIMISVAATALEHHQFVPITVLIGLAAWMSRRAQRFARFDLSTLLWLQLVFFADGCVVGAIGEWLLPGQFSLLRIATWGVVVALLGIMLLAGVRLQDTSTSRPDMLAPSPPVGADQHPYPSEAHRLVS